MSKECVASDTEKNTTGICPCKQKCEEGRIVVLVLYDDTVAGTEFECEKTYIIRTKLDEKRFREAVEYARALLNTIKDEWDYDDLVDVLSRADALELLGTEVWSYHA